jgi:hypothetical protein
MPGHPATPLPARIERLRERLIREAMTTFSIFGLF